MLDRESLGRVWLTTRWMIIEEVRHHTSHSNRYAFYSFPIFTFTFSFLICVFFDSLSRDMSMDQMMLSAHGSLLMYGMGMGAFTFFGQEFVERRHDRRNFLITSPFTHPISFRESFWAFYLHDVVFYILITILPLGFGLLLSVHWTGFAIPSVFRFMFSLFITFMTGLSLSFLLSSLYLRSRGAFTAAFAALGGLVISVAYFTGDFTNLLPSLQFFKTRYVPYILLAWGAIFTMSWSALGLISDNLEGLTLSDVRGKTNEIMAPSSFPPGDDILLKKEFLDIRRSRTLTRIIFSFVVPLLFITFMAWFVNRGLDLDVGFNLVFYGGMVGFFGILTYSWLALMDGNDYYQTLPVTVPRLIKTKVKAYLWITMGISAGFLVVVGTILNQLHLLWIALILMGVTSVYFVCAVAYLTGLRPNSSLFDITVLARFSILSLLPLSGITVLSIVLEAYFHQTLAGLALVCLVLGVGTRILYKGIDTRWSGEEFTV